MHRITLELSDELINLAKINKEHLFRDTLKLLILELFREELISLGKAAELSGLSVTEFMEFLASRRVPLHYGEQELKQDRSQFERLKL